MSRTFKAFTLVEMLVTLSLTAMVVVFVGYAFRTVSTFQSKVSSSISANESTYMLMAEVERSFKNSLSVQRQFKTLKFEDVQFDLGSEYAIRKQGLRSDTFPSVLQSPVIGTYDPSAENGLPKDSLSFEFHESRHTIWRRSSLVDHINKKIERGTD